MMRRTARRELSAEDRALWEAVMRSAKPLRPLPSAAPPDSAPAAVPPPGPAPGRAAGLPPRPSAPPRPVLPPLAPLERRMIQRLVRGAAEIEARLDLHGLTEAEAHDALHGFLLSAQTRGLRLVLVVTGKGRSPDSGALRRLVPIWLALPGTRRLVVGFEPARPAHGGAGAHYVRIRRRKGPVS